MEQKMLEVVARTRLMDVLQNEGVRIAFPIGDGDVDMLASIDSRSTAGIWIPISVIAAYSDALSGRFEHLRVPGLLVAIILDIDNADAEQAYRTFALTPAELTVVRMVVLIARRGAARAASKADSGRTSQRILQSALEPFVIGPGQWRRKFTAVLEDRAP
jgi:hypothetical protein